MILELEPRRAISSPLLRYMRNVTSQFGEDGIIEHIIDVIKPADKYCVEFGAWDGVLHSNCNNLLKNHGWSGLMIEADPDKFTKLMATYRGFPKVSYANRFVNFTGEDRLDQILGEEEAPKSFGVLSIDIDGNDYYIWESLTAYTPEIVVIEMNPSIPNDVVFVQDKSFEVNQGCSLLALIRLGRQKGYELAVCTEGNAIFVRRDKFPLLGVTDNDIWALYRPDQDGRIFHGFDGTFHVVGVDRLLWHEKFVSSADFQVLPKAQRVFNDSRKPTDK